VDDALPEPRVSASPGRDCNTPPVLAEAMDVLLSFGAVLLRAGTTAIRAREQMEILAGKLGLDTIAVSIAADSLTVSARGGGEHVIAMREIGPPHINVMRIDELEQLARTLPFGASPDEVAARLKAVESLPTLYALPAIALAIGAASGGFAFMNAGAGPEIAAAAIGGAIGHCVRVWMARRGLNQYAVAALTAVAASATYLVVAELAARTGLGVPRHPAGFIASVLFLVPGFPLLAALFDLLQYQTVAAVSRFAYGMMMLLAVAFGLSIVIAVSGIDLSAQPPAQIPYALKLLLRAVASFAGGCAFAMLFNSPVRAVIAAGLVAIVANELRLVLIDYGMMLAPAAFFGALAVGLMALVVDRQLELPRVAAIVPPIVIMIPGIYIFATIVFFNRGQALEALQAFASSSFVIGGLAMGVAVARFFDRR
jgi:uncharacterized membrane protein YjjP (DUF1212 family)